jgi:hypothetical protein
VQQLGQKVTVEGWLGGFRGSNHLVRHGPANRAAGETAARPGSARWEMGHLCRQPSVPCRDLDRTPCASPETTAAAIADVTASAGPPWRALLHSGNRELKWACHAAAVGLPDGACAPALHAVAASASRGSSAVEARPAACVLVHAAGWFAPCNAASARLPSICHSWRTGRPKFGLGQVEASPPTTRPSCCSTQAAQDTHLISTW